MLKDTKTISLKYLMLRNLAKVKGTTNTPTTRTNWDLLSVRLPSKHFGQSAYWVKSNYFRRMWYQKCTWWPALTSCKPFPKRITTIDSLQRDEILQCRQNMLDKRVAFFPPLCSQIKVKISYEQLITFFLSV